MSRRVCVITTGHLATCPRMLKAADAFADAGHDVQVVMIRSGGWAAEADARLCATRRWKAHIVSYDRHDAHARWLWSGVRQKVAVRMLDAVPATRSGLPSLVRALSRVGPEIVGVARALDADFYYAGAAGAIGLAALAARGRAQWGVDFEDAHGIEPLELRDVQQARRMSRLESTVVAGNAALLTAAGDGVAGYYRERYGVLPMVINNVFPLGERPTPRASRQLAIYWFSQTIGPRRGLDLLVEALGRVRVPVTLTLRGRVDESFVRPLRARAAEIAPHVDLRIEPPEDPDVMVTAAAAHDVGVSLEDAAAPHHAVCTSNKLFVYLSAGLAIAAIPTPGQVRVLSSAPEAVASVDPHDTSGFEAAIRRWAEDPAALFEARLAAWEAARKRWRWDHPCERDALVARVNEILH